MKTVAFNTQQAWFLANGRCDDATRTNLTHIGAKKGRAFQTNGHVAYLVDFAGAHLTDEYQAVDAHALPIDAPKPPTIDAVIELATTGKRSQVVLSDLVLQQIRTLCAAAQGVNERLEKEWRKEPKKTRATSAATCGVRLVGGDYGLTVSIHVRNKAPITMRVSEAFTPKFAIELDADYLADAIDAFDEMKAAEVSLNAPTEDGMSPVLFSVPGYTALIMPRRF